MTCEHASKTHVAFKKNIVPGDFFVFYIKNVYKTKNICLIKKILNEFVDTHADIPNMHRATFYQMCIFEVHFGAFSMVNLALKCTKK